MICSVKPVLTADLCVVQKEEFALICYMCEIYTWRKAKHIIRDKPIFSSERKLHKDYYRKSSVEKVSGRGSQGAWRQDELNGRKPPVVSNFDFDFTLNLTEFNLFARYSPDSNDVNTEDGEYLLLRSVARKRLVKVNWRD
jgi:hypothetical protein